MHGFFETLYILAYKLRIFCKILVLEVWGSAYMWGHAKRRVYTGSVKLQATTMKGLWCRDVHSMQ